MYKILGADQKEYGPASVDQVRQWIAEGRITAQTQVKAEGGTEWKSPLDFHEFQTALAAKSMVPVHTPPPIPSDSPPANGLAKTSLVLGILSLLGCSIISGIPAVIAGHIAYNRSRKAPQQFGDGRLAVAGLVMGYLSLVLIPVIAIVAGMTLPALAKAKDRAQRINCASNMKQIGLAARMWSTDHEGKFPLDFASMSNELATPKILVCPGDASKTRVMNWSEFSPGNVTYEYLEPGIDEKAAAQMVVFQCPIHGNIGMGDGSVHQGGQRTKRLGR